MIAFEPDPQNFQLLKKNISVNRCGNVQAFQKGVSDFNGAANFFFTARDPESGSLITGYQGDSIQTTISVEVVKLDDFLAKIGVKEVDILKIDVDGSEPLVFSGALEVIKHSPRIAIFYEFNIKTMEILGINPLEHIRQFRDLGFKIYGIDEAQKGPRELRFNWEVLVFVCSRGNNLLLTREDISY